MQQPTEYSNEVDLGYCFLTLFYVFPPKNRFRKKRISVKYDDFKIYKISDFCHCHLPERKASDGKSFILAPFLIASFRIF